MNASKRSVTRRRLPKLLETLRGEGRLLIVVHDAPDPDAMAGAMALRYLLRGRLGLESVILYGGFIGRPDNRAMASSLDAPLTPVAAYSRRPGDRFICLDTQPAFTNNSLPEGAECVAVIDHHPLEEGQRVPFIDVRPHYGAVATMLGEYLIESGLEFSRELATGLAFGVLSETEDLGRSVSRADLEVYMKVLPRVDHVLLGRLQHPRVERPFFRTLAAALEAARLRGELVTCHLAELHTEDELSRVADELNSLAGARWVLCTGLYEGAIYVCLRSSDADAEAHRVMEKIMAGRGGSGGHDMVAGGQIELEAGDEPAEIRADLTRRLLESLGCEEDRPGEPLLSPPAEEMIPEEQK